ncbi:hypothetical protein HGRIS_004648 [Hohenbuehelia grisea]|uniref:Nitronate monooxygenase domain-containing protein n=1 Tax=Hohenbuehelia grisea TaxID=104357 RepID=A0ABR3JDR7_9AGAR
MSTKRISTTFTRLLDVRTPIVSAPMAGASGGALAAGVVLGGGFGFIAAGYDSASKFSSELELARSILGKHIPDRLPLGVGFLCWQLEKPNSPAVDLLTIALERRVQAIWFSFGTEIGRWAQYVRDYDRKLDDGHKTIIFAQIASVEEALVAVRDWKVDVLVAQGNESGGHGVAASPPLLTLLPAVLSLIRQNEIPVLGAGGLSSGAHAASLLALGASGVVYGTRFLLTPESLYSDAQKEALLGAGVASTVRTMAFDVARGTLGWPSGVDGRGLRNETVEDYDNGRDHSELRQNFDEAMRQGDQSRMLVWAGTGVGLMNEILPAKDVLEELHRACVEHLQLAYSCIASDED